MEELQWEEERNKLWEDLRSANPEQIEQRIGVSGNGGRYRLPFLGREYFVDVAAGRIQGPETDQLSRDPEFELLLLMYLLRSMHIDPSGKWVSEKELPGGTNFFPPRITLLFDSTIEFQLPLDMVLALGHSFAMVLQALP
jgi:hypothetical protein